MRFLSMFRKKRLSHRKLQELYRSSERGMSLQDVPSEARAEFEADQQLINRMSELATSVGPTDIPLKRSALLSRVAEERKRRQAEQGTPMFVRRLPKRTFAVASAILILIAAAATVGAAGGVSDFPGNFDDVLVAIHITGSKKVDVCHSPPDSPDNSHTISVGKSALDEHLAHGDSEGACAESGSQASPDGAGQSSKVDVCHLSPDDPDNSHTISVGKSALDEHLAHGDSEGACAESRSQAPPDGAGQSSKVDVCHLSPDDPDNSHTISVGKGALDEHLAHGDSAGACAETASANYSRVLGLSHP